MATPQTMEEAKAELQRLQDALAAGEIDLAEYGQQVGPIMGLMNTGLQLDTEIERPIGSQTDPLLLETEDKMGKAVYAQQQREAELDALGGKEEDVSEQFKRATENIERELYPQRFATKEYDEPISPARMVSAVRDPVKGLVRDKETGQLRKAGFLELLGEGMKRQVFQTPRTKVEIEQEYARQDRQLYNSLLAQGKTEEEAQYKVNQARDLRDSPLFGEKIEPLEATEDVLKPEDKAMVVESPFEWGLRTLTNTGSALVAPLIKEAQDVVSIITRAPVSTRKDQGYKKTQRDELGMQFITNFLLNQGVMSQQQAQLFPADEKYDGLLNIATQGSFGSLALGLAAEIAAPTTPLGVPSEVAKMTKVATKPFRASRSAAVQKLASIIENPIEAIRYAGQKAEVDAALRTIDEGLTAKKLEKEIAEQGGVINRSSLREKAAQKTGDTIATLNVLIIEAEKKLSQVSKQADDLIKKGDSITEIQEKLPGTDKIFIDYDLLKIKESPFLNAIFNGRNKISLNEVFDLFKRMYFPLKDAKFIKDNPALRRITDIANEVERFVLGKSPPSVSKPTKSLFSVEDVDVPKMDAKIVRRNIYKSLFMNKDIWDYAVKNAFTSKVQKAAVKGRALTEKSYFEPLTVPEISELGKLTKQVVDDIDLFDDILKKSSDSRVLYDSIRGSVADVMRDNFLKNVPDDYIFVSENVAVPMSAYKSKNFNIYKDRIRDSWIFKPEIDEFTNTVIYKPDRSRLKSLNDTLTASGRWQTLSEEVQSQLRYGLKLTPRGVQEVMSAISSELALDLLDGIRLKTGTMTAQMARLPSGTPRQTLIRTGATPASFRLQSKGLANAIRLIVSQSSLLDEIAGTLFGELKKMQTGLFTATEGVEKKVRKALGRPGFDVAPKGVLPPTLQRFSDDVMRAHNASIDQVLERYTQAARNAPKGKETESFNSVLAQDLEKGVDQYAKKIEKTSLTAMTDVQSLPAEVGEKAQNRAYMRGLSEKFGDKNIREYLEQQGIPPTAEALINNIDEIEDDMFVVLDSTARIKQWKSALNDFFTAGPVGKNESRLKLQEKYIRYVEDLVRLDPLKPFWTPNNVLPLNIENFKYIIEEIRNKDEFLRNVGLSQMKPFKQEYYTLPLLARSFEVQRLSNMEEAIQRLINEEPDMFIKLDRVQSTTPGLEMVEIIANNISGAIRESSYLAVKEGLVTQKAVNTISRQIQEILFDGFANDLWRNSDRATQKLFFQEYLNTMIRTKSPIIQNMDSYIVSLFNNNILKSNTFARIEKKIANIMDEVYQNFDVLKQQPKQLGLFKKTSSINDQIKIIEVLEEQLPKYISEMSLGYLRALVMGTEGFSSGLFSKQLAEVNRYFTQFGVNDQSLAIAMKEMSPRFEYIGSENLALIYGADMQKQIDNLIDMTNATSSSQLSRYLEQLAAYKQDVGPSYIGHYIAESLSMSRRWAVSNMLGGSYEFAMRYFGTNSFTAPFIYLTTLGDSSIKASTFAKFTGAAVTGGVFPALEKIASKKGFSTGIASNRYLYAPAEQVIIKAKPGGAVRDYTAGELRALAEEYGINFSRADVDFYDTQFEKFLINAKLKPDGSSRYSGPWLKVLPPIAKKMWDNFSPSRRNIFTDLGKFQDTQQRRLIFVDALENGETVGQAAEKARRSILDYNSLSDFEKRNILPVIYFYSFLRTMGAEVMNAFYRAVMSGNNVPFKVLQVQNALNRQMAQDYVDQQDALKGRFFNIYNTTVDGVDIYAGGMMNPQVDMFDMMSRAALVIASGFEEDPYVRTTEQKIAKLAASIMMTGAGALEYTIRGNPYLGLALDAMLLDFSRRPIPFPSELILDAESSGRLPEVIQMYGLKKRDYKTPGRPLSAQGDYWDFPQTDEGRNKYRMYLMHRAIGLTSFNLIAYKGGWVAAQSRGQKEVTRANIYGKKDLTIIDPNDPTKTVTIKDFTSYAKAIGRGDLQLSPDVLYYLYRLGLTPMKSVPIEQVEERILRDIDRTLKDKIPRKE